MTREPTPAPTNEPTARPTPMPTNEPTLLPTSEPTRAPTSAPTLAPTPLPSLAPTSAPSSEPTTMERATTLLDATTMLAVTATSDAGTDAANRPDAGVAVVVLVMGSMCIGSLIATVFIVRHRERRRLGGGAVSQQQVVGVNENDVALEPPARSEYDIPIKRDSVGDEENGVIAALSSSGKSVAIVQSESTSALPLDRACCIDDSELVRGRKLGEGAYGLVFAGEWRNIDVAIKEIKGVNDDAARQLRDEAARFSSMKPHANVVKFYGYVDHPLAVVLAFCSGGSLEVALYGKRARHFDATRVHAIMTDIAKGVAHLHAEGVIHRDLAARNVLLDEHERAMVTDFGMSRVNASNDVETVATTKTTVGSLKWMAPEQMRLQEYSEKSDVWSMAVVFFECIAREPPFKGQSATQAAISVMNGETLVVPASASAGVCAIMHACWRYNASERPTANDIVKQLRSVM